jgi:RNA polymerase sigma-70 factor (ECF subfamily)
VVTINRAIAVSHTDGPAAALRELHAMTPSAQSERYVFLHAAEAEFNRQLGNHAQAALCLERVLRFAHTDPQRRFLQRKLEALRAIG